MIAGAAAAGRGDLLVTRAGLRFLGRQMPCTVGRGGIVGTKREGDGATPAGIHRITGMLYRPDRLPRPVPWAISIGLRDLWCDDPDSSDYNRRVSAPFAGSAERLRLAGPLYDLILLTDWNRPDPVPGRGSAIFLHRRRRPGAPTAGCVAISTRDLRWIAGRVRPGTRLIVGG